MEIQAKFKELKKMQINRKFFKKDLKILHFYAIFVSGYPTSRAPAAAVVSFSHFGGIFPCFNINEMPTASANAAGKFRQ